MDAGYFGRFLQEGIFMMTLFERKYTFTEEINLKLLLNLNLLIMIQKHISMVELKLVLPDKIIWFRLTSNEQTKFLCSLNN